MSHYLYQLISYCFKEPYSSVQELEQPEDWNSSPLSIPEGAINKEPTVPFDPFGVQGHRHLTYTDCQWACKQFDHIYPNIKHNPELAHLIHRPRVSLIEPHDLIQALNHWGFHCQVIPQPQRLRVSHECNHTDRHIVPSVVDGEFLCIACIDEEIAT